MASSFQVDPKDVEAAMARIKRQVGIRAAEEAVERIAPVAVNVANSVIRHFRGYEGGKGAGVFDKAVYISYGIDPGRSAHPGGWADLTVWLARYPKAIGIMAKLLRGRAPVFRPTPMREQFFAEVQKYRSGDERGLLVQIGNKAFYADWASPDLNLDIAHAFGRTLVANSPDVHSYAVAD